MQGKHIIIAIDGFSSCGKSTLARDLAGRLGYRYIDTGAMYRAVTYYLLENHIDIKDHDAVVATLPHIVIGFLYDPDNGKQITLLNGRNIEKEIRSPDVSNKVSPVSAIHEVREFLVKQQKDIGRNGGIVMDGRDIGTVVFPHAELKLFMTADEEKRVERRFDELRENGEIWDIEDVRENIRRRDYTDTHREESPLRQAEDAIVIDNTNLTMEEQLDIAYELAQRVILQPA
jgi:cytidylate kinase